MMKLRFVENEEKQKESSKILKQNVVESLNLRLCVCTCVLEYRKEGWRDKGRDRATETEHSKVGKQYIIQRQQHNLHILFPRYKRNTARTSHIYELTLQLS